METLKKTAGRLWINWPWFHGSWHRDVAVALAVGAIQVVGTYFAAHDQADRRPLDAGAIALLAIVAAALVARRPYPAAVLVFTHTVTLLYWVLDYPRGPVFLAMIVAFFTAIMHRHRVVAWLSLPFGFIAFPWLPVLLTNAPVPSWTEILGIAAWLLVLGTVAEVVRMQRERAAEAAHAREEEARQRASEERLRIARELHDVLGHNISLISVQASVALHLFDERPEQARSALAAIKEASRNALRELRSALDVLRQGDEQLPRSPTPSLAHLDDLVFQAAAAGLQVRTEISGEPRRLPSEVDLAGFRIVQEALTNVVRHAAATTATVRLAYGVNELTVQVDDDGRGAVSYGDGSGGRGVLGMQERAAALGGLVEAGPRPEGGFRVLARLPLVGDPSTGLRTGS